MVLSPQKLWESYDRSLMPLDVSEIYRGKTAFGEERRVYFNGEPSALGCTRIYARLLTPAQPTDKLVIVFPEPTQDVHGVNFDFLLEKNWAVLVTDYAGNAFDRARFTIYPSALSFADYNEQTIYAPADAPQKTCWYIWTTVCLRSVTFAQNQGFSRVALFGMGAGGSGVLKTAALSDFPVCALSLFSPGFFPATDDPELLGLSVSINVSGYVPMLKIPFLQLCCSNDADSSLDAISDYMEQSNKNGILHIAPRVDRSITQEIFADVDIFLSSYLTDERPPAPEELAPETTFTLSGSQKQLYLSLQYEKNVQDVRFYVSHGIANAAYRNWREVPAEKAGENEYIGCTEVFFADRPVYAFCYITTDTGFSYCTPVEQRLPSALHITPATIVKRRLIYESDMGLDDFFTTDERHPPEMKAGPFDIEGICGRRGLCTYKLGDVAFSGAPDSALSVLIFSSVPQQITFSVTDQDQFNTYTCTKTVSPDADWTKLILSASDLKSADGAFAGWHRAIFLRIDAQEEFIISSLLWV